MGKLRKNYPPEFKVKVALEIIKGDKTMSQICSEYSVHATQAVKWKKQALETLQSGFKQVTPESEKLMEQSRLIDDLYKELGKTKIENEYLKKNLSLIS